VTTLGSRVFRRRATGHAEHSTLPSEPRMIDLVTPRPTTKPTNCVVLLREDLDTRLDHLVRDLIAHGHHLLIESEGGHGPAGFATGDGLRVYGDAGVLNARTLRVVVEDSISEADGSFHLDLDGLDHLGLLSWAAALHATQEFRSRGGVLHVHARGRTRRLVEKPTAIESDRTNLEIT
jgi:hypothetical protein